MNKEFVQAYSRLEKKHWWFVSRQKIIVSFLKKYKGKTPLSILNIGAAGGASSQWLSTFGNVVSLETEPFFISYLQLQGINVVNASVTGMPFADNSFDLVCAFDVIEHVADDIAAVKEMERICKPGGIICITVPAFNSLWSNHDVINGHYRRYKKRSLSFLVGNAASLKKEEIKYFNSLLFIPIFIARKISNLFLRNAPEKQSDFELYKIPGLVNQLLKAIFSSESFVLKFIHFPFGVSLIGVWKKTGSSK